MILRLKRASAFTIVELLVAAAITTLIVVLLGTMFGSLTTTTSRANQRIDAFRDARAAIQMIERDLSGLVQAIPSAYYAATDRYNDPNPAAQKNRQLYALCALRNKPAGNPPPIAGDMCALGYYCRWDTDAAGQRGHYVLCRYFRDSDVIFQGFKTNGAGTYMPAANLYNPSTDDDVLATYVWDLQVIPYKADGTVYTVEYPVVIDPSDPLAVLPAFIEISFKAMSPQAARTIMNVSNNPEDWMSSASPNYQRLVRPNAYTFRTRIRF
jgi:type II secretory pathway pseudopilin PulG